MFRTNNFRVCDTLKHLLGMRATPFQAALTYNQRVSWSFAIIGLHYLNNEISIFGYCSPLNAISLSIFEYFHIFIYSTNWLIHSFNFLSLFFHFDQFESIQAPLKRKTSQLIQTRHRMHHRQRLKRIQANQLRAAHLIKMVSKLTTASIEEHVKVSCFAPLYGALTYLPTHTRTHANTHTAKEACTHTRVFLFFSFSSSFVCSP